MIKKAKNTILILVAMLTITTGFSAGNGKDKDKDKNKPCPGVTYAKQAKKPTLKDVFTLLGEKIKNIHLGKKEGPVYMTGITKQQAKKHTENNRKATKRMIESYHERETFMGYATDESAPTVVTK